MLRSGRLLFASWVAAASGASLAACSLAVDTSGLSSGGVAPSPESGTADASDSDARTTDGALPDATFTCDGGTRITSFDGFTTMGSVSLQGGMLTATASSTAKSEKIVAAARRDFPSAPRVLSLSYDLTITESQDVYFEPGCGVYLENSQQTLFRQTFASNHGAFSGYLNIDLLDGGEDSRNHQYLGALGGEATHHIELRLTRTAGTNIAADVSVNGSLQSDSLVLPATPNALFIRCGITYGQQLQPGSFTTNVGIENFSLTLCP